MRIVDDPEAMNVMRRDDPLAPARVRGQEARFKLLDENGGSLTAAEVAGLLGITRQAVDNRRKAGRLIGLTLGRRGFAYPAWQFDRGRVLPGLEEVLRELHHLDPWMQTAFIVSGNRALDDQSPLTLLRRGKMAAVLAAARVYGEQGPI